VRFGRPILRPLHQLWQRSDVEGNAPSLIAREQVGGGGVRPRLILVIIGAVGPRYGCHTSEGSPL
jgi:hypothetical protein